MITIIILIYYKINICTREVYDTSDQNEQMMGSDWTTILSRDNLFQIFFYYGNSFISCNDIELATSILTTDLYKVPDAVPPIHAESYHVATDKVPAKDGDKFRSIFRAIYNQSQFATRGKKARGTLLVDKHCGNGCSIKCAPLSVSYYNEI